MKLSVLILAHNRPALFERCLQSVLLNKPSWAEILINNDTSDITEIPGATYYYERNYDISKIYKYLFDAAIGEFIYYLEDDDYVVPNFWDIISKNLNSKNLIFKYIPDKKLNYNLEKFITNIDPKLYFQLSQLIFKKSDLKLFPMGNDINNDWKLRESLESECINMSIPIFVQTIDGQDNISFTKDTKFSGQDFCGECERNYCRYSCERQS